MDLVENKSPVVLVFCRKSFDELVNKMQIACLCYVIKIVLFALRRCAGDLWGRVDANINRLGFNIVTILQVDIEYILGILYTMYNASQQNIAMNDECNLKETMT